MILVALLAAAQVPTRTVPPPVPAPPTDWSALPDLRFVRPSPIPATLSQFVRDEVAAGRCASAQRTAGGEYMLTVSLMVRVGPNGTVYEVVPRAIGCPTVEQYASGVVSRMARGNVAPVAGWFRTSVVFAWQP